MQNLINDFLQNLQFKNYSTTTQLNYACDLQAFKAWAEEHNKPLQAIKAPDLRLYMQGHTNQAPSTISRKIATLKSFYKWLVINEHLEVNPALSLEAPKQAKKQPDIINDDDTHMILTLARDYATENDKYFRDYTMLAMFLHTGIRREELVNIMFDDVQQDKILIHGKGNKERYVYINEDLSTILTAYMSHYRAVYKQAKESPYLFVSAKSGRLDLATVNRAINKYMELSQCKKEGRSVHTLRKKSANAMYKATGDIYAVSNILGHESINTTKIYVQADEDRMRATAAAIKF